MPSMISASLRRNLVVSPLPRYYYHARLHCQTLPLFLFVTQEHLPPSSSRANNHNHVTATGSSSSWWQQQRQQQPLRSQLQKVQEQHDNSASFPLQHHSWCRKATETKTPMHHSSLQTPAPRPHQRMMTMTSRGFGTMSQQKQSEARQQEQEQNQQAQEEKPTTTTTRTTTTTVSSNNNRYLQVHSTKDMAVTTATTTSSSSISQQKQLDLEWQEFTMAQEQEQMWLSPSYTSTSSSLKDSVPSQHVQLFNKDLHLASAPSDWKGYERSTPLFEELQAQIGVTGHPISIAEFMRQCLTHPVHGYYTKAHAGAATSGAAVGVKGGPGSVDEFDLLDEQDLDDGDTKLNIGGDFVTAPEVSQIFGESLGIWIMLTAQQQELVSPTKGVGQAWQYLEAGPGRGSLLSDLMRFWHRMGQGKVIGPSAIPAAVHLIETSPKLKQVQRQQLQQQVGRLYDLEFVDFGGGASRTTRPTTTTTATPRSSNTTNSSAQSDTPRHPMTIYWHDTLISFKLWQHQHESYLPTFCICQEFLDALPIYAFQKTEEGWRERLVDVALRDDILKEEEELVGIVRGENNTELLDGQKLRLRLVLAPSETRAAKILLRLDPETGLIPYELETGHEAPVGSVIEVNPEAIFMVQDLAKIVANQGGGALLVDYGQEGSRDTIRGFSAHKQVPFLSQPGNIDITADVDFGALKHAVNTLDFSNLKMRMDDDQNGNDNRGGSGGRDEKDTKKTYAAPLLPVTPQRIARAYGPVGQGIFLMTMGVKDRALQLSEDATLEQQEALYMALVRLCDPNEMGERFKVMAITRPVQRFGLPQTPPGF